MDLSCKHFHETQTQIISFFNLPLIKRIKNITRKNYFVTHFTVGVINRKQKTAITNSLPNRFSQHSKMIIRMSGTVPSNLKKIQPNSPPPKVQRFSVIPPVLRNAPSVIWMKRYSFNHLLWKLRYNIHPSITLSITILIKPTAHSEH